MHCLSANLNHEKSEHTIPLSYPKADTTNYRKNLVEKYQLINEQKNFFLANTGNQRRQSSQRSSPAPSQLVHRQLKYKNSAHM